MKSEQQFTVDLLQKVPELAATAADWLRASRAHFYPHETLEDAQRLLASCRPDGIPFCLLAHLNGEMAGMACVLPDAAPPGYGQLSPWLAALGVAPAFQGQGQGQGLEMDLLARAAARASAAGCAGLYVWTFDDKEWYQRQGWQLAGTTIFGRRYVVVLRLTLAD